MARMESHASWAAWNTQRMEMESLARADDIKDFLRHLVVRVEKQERAVSAGSGFMKKWLSDLFGTPRQAVQTIIGLLAITGVLSGKITLGEAINTVGGLP